MNQKNRAITKHNFYLVENCQSLLNKKIGSIYIIPSFLISPGVRIHSSFSMNIYDLLYPCVEILRVTLYILKGETLELGLKDTQQEHHVWMGKQVASWHHCSFFGLGPPSIQNCQKWSCCCLWACSLMKFGLSSPKSLRQSSYWKPTTEKNGDF